MTVTDYCILLQIAKLIFRLPVIYRQAPLAIEGVPILNKVALNSCRGTLYTDQGPWSPRAAKILEKDHGYCTKHKTTAIFPSSAGLAKDQRKAYIKDMYALIYKFTDESELDNKIEECLEEYDTEPAEKFIKGVASVKENLCRAYTQKYFSFNHTTTQRVTIV